MNIYVYMCVWMVSIKIDRNDRDENLISHIKKKKLKWNQDT